MTIRARNITWRIGPTVIIDDVSLEAHPGRMIGLIGPNGSGKSSLLRLLAGLRRPSEGQVLLDDHDIRQFKRKVIAQRIAFVEQQASTEWNVSVRHVVQLGRIPHRSAFSTWNKSDEAAVISALEHVGITNLQDRLWHSLSGGERQRVQLARALAQSPSELILDEPTNHLDIQHQLELLELVGRLPATCVVAVHDLNHAAMFCDRLVVMQKGCIVAEGTPSEVLTEGLLSDVFRVSARVESSPYHGRPHIHFLGGSHDAKPRFSRRVSPA